MIASAFSSGSLTLQYFTAAQHFVFHKWSLEEYRSHPRNRSHETNKLRNKSGLTKVTFPSSHTARKLRGCWSAWDEESGPKRIYKKAKMTRLRSLGPWQPVCWLRLQPELKSLISLNKTITILPFYFILSFRSNDNKVITN